MAIKLTPFIVATAIASILTGCGESSSSSQGAKFEGDNPATVSFDEAKLIVNLTDNIITPTYVEFVNQTNLQTTAISSYCELESEFDATLGDEAAQQQLDTAKLAAQQAWKNTTQLWQYAELMQLGPLLTNDGELRNKIYSWPAVSKCNVDQDVVYFEEGVINQDENRPYDIKQRVSTRRGLVALEHLLFNTELNHNCSASSAGQALSTWNTRTEQSRKIARCNFAVEAAKDLTLSGNELLSLWQGENGFALKLKLAGQADSPFSSTHEAVNHLSDALFYTDSIVKDKKLGIPLGKFANSCGLEACAEDLESFTAEYSLENIKANLLAFEMLFSGTNTLTNDQTGFDDFLIEQDALALKTAILASIQQAQNAAQSIDSNLKQALETDLNKVEEVHAKVKDITDVLKEDFINKLALELPATSAGDND